MFTFAEQADEMLIAVTTTTALPPSIGPGSCVLVAGEKGVFLVAGHNKDGSLTCFPASDAHGGARSFLPEWCALAERTGKGGKLIRVRSVPPAARRAHTLWREQHGFHAAHGADVAERLPAVAR